MFFRFLDHIRQQPLAVREQYALWLTVGIVGCIGVAWLVFLPHRFTGVGAGGVGAETSRPFSQILQQFQDTTTPTPSVPPTPAATTAATTSLAQPPQLELSAETLAELAARRATTSTETVGSPHEGSSRAVRIATSSSTTTPATE